MMRFSIMDFARIFLFFPLRKFISVKFRVRQFYIKQAYQWKSILKTAAMLT